MKKLSKLVLVIFSVIILIIGVGINLLVAKWVDFDTVFRLIQNVLTKSPQSEIVLVFTEICMLLAIICIFTDT